MESKDSEPLRASAPSAPLRELPGERLKVLHVIPSVSPRRGGPSFMLRTIAFGLAGEGVEVHVATTDDDGPGRAPRPLGKPVAEEGVVFRFFPRQVRFYTLSWPLALWLARHVGDYDVVHAHALFSFPPVAAAWFARRAGVPCVIRPLGTLSRWGLRNRKPWLKKLSFRLVEDGLLRGAAAVHYTSRQELSEAGEFGARGRPVIIPNAVQPPEEVAEGAGEALRASWPGAKDRPWVLFLSRIDPKKGLDLLLTALARLDGPDAPALAVAGDGDPALVRRLKRRALNLGLRERVIWLGFLAGAEKRAAFAAADAFALPSRSENFGIAVVEAMACGLPVLITDQVGIHQEVSQAGAGVVVPVQESALAEGLRLLLGEGNPQMGAHAKALAQDRFSVSAVSRSLRELYTQIVADRRGGPACPPAAGPKPDPAA